MSICALEYFRCSSKKCKHHETTFQKYAWDDRTKAVKCDCGSDLVEQLPPNVPRTFSIGKWNSMSSTERGKVMKKRSKAHSLKDRDKWIQMNHKNYIP